MAGLTQNLAWFKERVVRITPTRYREFLRRQMIYAGIKEELTERFISFSLFFTLFLGVVLAFDFWLLGFGLIGILIGLAVGVSSLIIIHLSIVLTADSRAEEIEKILPDALQLIAANVRAGMTIDRAIWLAARPEFGVFEEEIKRAGAKTLGGKPIKDALMEMAYRVKSNLLEKMIRLIIEGIESGGEMANLLEATANNARSTQSMKKEIKSSVTTYSIFIFFSAVLGAPALYSISIFFVNQMSKLWSPQVLGIVGSSSAGFGTGLNLLSRASAPTISTNMLFWFAMASILVTTFFGSLLIGLIQTGKEKNGIKFIPLLAIGAILMFFTTQILLGVLFGGFFAI